MDILDQIIQTKRSEVAATDYKEIRRRALDAERRTVSMRQSLRQTPGGVIAEYKRHSPSKGWINREAEAAVVVEGYRRAGAAACSVLTDERYFKGSLDYLRAARAVAGSMPLLRKEFIIIPEQVYEAREAGADAVLLIAACLEQAQCEELAAAAHEVDLEVLLEVHDEAELTYLNPHIDMLGVNNRHLGTFHTDVATSYRIAKEVQRRGLDVTLVSESGIDGAATIRALQQQGFEGFLIGETLMRGADPAASLAQLLGAL